MVHERTAACNAHHCVCACEKMYYQRCCLGVGRDSCTTAGKLRASFGQWHDLADLISWLDLYEVACVHNAAAAFEQ